MAAEAADIERSTAYRWKDADPEFASQWENAEEEAADRLEQEAFRRAYHGTTKPVFHQGVVCGEVQEYSDTLLIVLLKARRPKKYRENVKVTVDDVDREIERELARLSAGSQEADASAAQRTPRAADNEL